jgi:hypothetical protein
MRRSAVAETGAMSRIGTSRDRRARTRRARTRRADRLGDRRPSDGIPGLTADSSLSSAGLFSAPFLLLLSRMADPKKYREDAERLRKDAAEISNVET